MKLSIKNMVCLRCKMTVEAELKKLGFDPLCIELGEVVFKRALPLEDIKIIGVHDKNGASEKKTGS